MSIDIPSLDHGRSIRSAALREVAHGMSRAAAHAHRCPLIEAGGAEAAESIGAAIAASVAGTPG